MRKIKKFYTSGIATDYLFVSHTLGIRQRMLSLIFGSYCLEFGGRSFYISVTRVKNFFFDNARDIDTNIPVHCSRQSLVKAVGKLNRKLTLFLTPRKN